MVLIYFWFFFTTGSTVQLLYTHAYQTELAESCLPYALPEEAALMMVMHSWETEGKTLHISP